MERVTRSLRSFGAFWYDFVIGDDWHAAAVAVAALALTALLVHAAGVNAWWLAPPCVFGALAWSLRRATASRPPPCGGPAAPAPPRSPPGGCPRCRRRAGRPPAPAPGPASPGPRN